MTRKIKQLTDEQILHICRSKERFSLNPLMYRHRQLVRQLERMRQQGKLSKKVFKLNYVEYYVGVNA